MIVKSHRPPRRNRIALHPWSGFAIRGQRISDCGWQGRAADEEDGPWGHRRFTWRGLRHFGGRMSSSVRPWGRPRGATDSEVRRTSQAGPRGVSSGRSGSWGGAGDNHKVCRTLSEIVKTSEGVWSPFYTESLGFERHFNPFRGRASE